MGANCLSKAVLSSEHWIMGQRRRKEIDSQRENDDDIPKLTAYPSSHPIDSDLYVVQHSSCLSSSRMIESALQTA